MSLLSVIFYFFEGLAALSAISLLFIRNIFHAALALLICLLSIAAIFAMSGAEFPAVAQILLYAGGIVVLIIFGIMLTNKSGVKPLPIKNNNTMGGVLVGLGTFFLLIFFMHKTLFATLAHKTHRTDLNPIQQIGTELMTDYLLPFELTGIILLVVLAGAAVVAGYKPTKA